MKRLRAAEQSYLIEFGSSFVPNGRLEAILGSKKVLVAYWRHMASWVVRHLRRRIKPKLPFQEVAV